LERQRAAERLRAQQFQASLEADHRVGRQEAFAQGFEEGSEKGLEKGELIGRIRMLQQFLHQPETSREELKRLSEEELLRMESSLKQQLSGKENTNGTSSTDKT
jgi:flagellar biosynthesis/type III secretory pathway protein FliH